MRLMQRVERQYGFGIQMRGIASQVLLEKIQAKVLHILKMRMERKESSPSLQVINWSAWMQTLALLTKTLV